MPKTPKNTHNSYSATNNKAYLSSKSVSYANENADSYLQSVVEQKFWHDLIQRRKEANNSIFIATRDAEGYSLSAEASSNSKSLLYISL